MAEKHDAKHDAKKQGGEKPQEQKAPARRPSQQSMKPIVSASGKEVRGVVRLAGRDLRGNLSIRRAITSVRGIGLTLGTVVSGIATEQLHMNDKTMLGELTEEEILKLEQVMLHPESFGVPVRMLNRRKDVITGKDSHLISTDLAYAVKQDIDHEKESNTWRGYRHTYGQKVRGQRTRSTGRTGMTVGVLRKAVLAKAGEAAAATTGAAAQAAGAKAAAPAAGAKGASPAAKAPAAAAPKAAPAAKPEAKK
ncbi:MAG: 30S ribosomal protein S13 [Candidatus Micrarchaeia archaeon]